MRKKLAVVAAIVGAAAVFSMGIRIIAAARSSYSSFSRRHWVEVYSTAFDVSPSGELIVFTGYGMGERDLYLLDLKSRQIRQLARTPQLEAEVRFLDSNHVITSAVADPSTVSSAEHLYLVNTSSGVWKQLTQDPRMRDGTLVPLSEREVLFSRGEIRKYLNPIWGLLVGPWAAVDVHSVLVGDYLMDPYSGEAVQVHRTSVGIYLDQVAAVFKDRRKVIQKVSQGATSDLFLTRLSAPLGSSEIRAMRKERLARAAKCAVLSEDERFVYYVAEDATTQGNNVMYIDLKSRHTRKLLSRKQHIVRLRIAGEHLFFLEGSDNSVSLGRLNLRSNKVEQLLSPAQLANPLGG